MSGIRLDCNVGSTRRCGRRRTLLVHRCKVSFDQRSRSFSQRAAATSGYRPACRVVACRSAAPAADRPWQRGSRRAAVPRHLPRHRRHRPAELAGDRGQRLLLGQTASDFLALLQRQPTTATVAAGAGAAPLRTGLTIVPGRLRHSSRGDRLVQRRPARPCS
jgi:hypothetical protein